MTGQVNVYDAKAQLSKLIARVEAGEEITLARNGRPVARLVPLASSRPRRVPGAWKSRVSIAEDVDEFTEEDALNWYSV